MLRVLVLSEDKIVALVDKYTLGVHAGDRGAGAENGGLRTLKRVLRAKSCKDS